MENSIIINNCEYRNQWWSQAWLLGVFRWWSKFLFLEAFEKEVSQPETPGMMGWEESRFCCVFTENIWLQGCVNFACWTKYENHKVRIIKLLLLCLHTRKFVCRVVWVSQLCTKIENKEAKNEAVGRFLYKNIFSAGCEFLSQLEQKFKNNEMRRMRPLDGFCTRSSVCRMWISFTIWTLRMMSWGEWSCWDFPTIEGVRELPTPRGIGEPNPPIRVIKSTGLFTNKNVGNSRLDSS